MAMKIGSKKLLALDWDAQSLRMTVVTSRGANVDLHKAVTVPVLPEIELNDAAMFGGFIKESLKRSKLSGKHAIISVPREKVVLNTINLPPAPADELPAMVINQVARELPFAADQAVIDFALSNDHDPKSPATALVAAVRIDDIEFYKKVASAAGLHLERIGLRPFANRQAVMATVDDPNDKTILMVELGPEHSEISVVHDGTLKFSRSALTSLPDFREEAVDNLHDSRIDSLAIHDARSSERTREAVSGLMVEVIRSFEAYRASTSGASIDRIVVCGATGLEAELSQSLAARFAALAELFNPAKALTIDHDRARELRGFSVVLGLAMSHGRHPLSSFDFLAPKRPVTTRDRRMKKAPKAILTGVFLLAAAVAAWVQFVEPKRSRASELEADVQELSTRKKPLTAFQSRVNALEDWADAEQIWPDELVRLTNAFPSNDKAQVTRIEFHTRAEGRRRKRSYVSTVEMRLRTAELGVVNEISDMLREMGYQDVVPGSETPIRGRNDSVYQFESRIEAVIPKRKPKKVEPPTVEIVPDFEPNIDDVDVEPVIPDDVTPTDDQASDKQPTEDAPTVDEKNAAAGETDDSTSVATANDEDDGTAAKPEPVTPNEPRPSNTAPSERRPVTNKPEVAQPSTRQPPKAQPKQPQVEIGAPSQVTNKAPAQANNKSPGEAAQRKTPPSNRKRVSIEPVRRDSAVKKPIAEPSTDEEPESNDVIVSEEDDSTTTEEPNGRTRVRIPPVKPKSSKPAPIEEIIDDDEGENDDEATAELAITEEDER